MAKQVEKIADGANFAAISVGKMTEIKDYKLSLGPDVVIPGKVFIGQQLGTTGSQISFQSFAPGQDGGFLHVHKDHEEIYVIIKGKGEYQVDGKIFPIAEGTVFRVSPAGVRGIRNNGTEEMIMMCIQYKQKTFTAEDARDGDILKDPMKWN